eukprot:TRINITY_DN81361_c0_g1_i1.p1 TRINITY_DN81361_c0_g1~~TRINITY_DN81361_c0_g1_i1.p1  ORF type:complete len:432 (+),score=67.28 TRINITY_DN81361_c0_g1_i1:29-1324(+)
MPPLPARAPLAALWMRASSVVAMLPWDAANVPGPTWPGRTAQESNQAWPSGAQPMSLVAWPKKDGLAAPCWKVKTLEDTATGWQGGSCHGMTEISASSEEECAKLCNGNTNCAVWEFTTSSKCLQGTSLQCDDAGTSSSMLVGSQRLQHGDIRVLKDMTGWEVLGLRPLGMGTSNDREQQIKNCKLYCYSMLTCEYWLFGEEGCSIDDTTPRPDGSISAAEFPLTLTGATRDSTFAHSVVAGEYIQHICPPKSGSEELGGAPASSSSSSGVPLVWIAAGGAVALVALAAGVWMCSSQGAKAGNNRSVCIGEEEESEDDAAALEMKGGNPLAKHDRPMPVSSSPHRFTSGGSWNYMPVEHASPLPSEQALLSSGSLTGVPMPPVPQMPGQAPSAGHSFNSVGTLRSVTQSFGSVTMPLIAQRPGHAVPQRNH